MASDQKERRKEVEKCLLEHGWQGSWVVDLATEYDVSRRTIERDRLRVLERLGEDELVDREMRRARFLLELRRDRKGARTSKKWSAVATMANLEAKLLGLDVVPPPEPEADEEAVNSEGKIPGEEGEGGRLRAQLREVQRIRRDAQRRGSMVPVVKLFGIETELRALLLQLEREQKERARLAADDEAIVQRFAAAAAKLPPQLVARLLEILTGLDE